MAIWPWSLNCITIVHPNNWGLVTSFPTDWVGFLSQIPLKRSISSDISKIFSLWQEIFIIYNSNNLKHVANHVFYPLIWYVFVVIVCSWLCSYIYHKRRASLYLDARRSRVSLELPCLKLQSYNVDMGTSVSSESSPCVWWDQPLL